VQSQGPFVALLLISLLSLPAVGQGTGEHEIFASPETATPNGTWRYRELRDETSSVCGQSNTKQCITYKLRVENTSADTLECESLMSYDGVDSEGLPRKGSVKVVMPKQTLMVMSDWVQADALVLSATVDCKARPRRPRLNIPKECRFQVLQAPMLEDFYPAAARRLSEEGPVEMQFTLEKPQGHASDISVTGSSLSQRLDGAAIGYLESVTFSTPCPNTRYELRVLFKLNDPDPSTPH
jgi:TonB family protein